MQLDADALAGHPPAQHRSMWYTVLASSCFSFWQVGQCFTGTPDMAAAGIALAGVALVTGVAAGHLRD